MIVISFLHVDFEICAQMDKWTDGHFFVLWVVLVVVAVVVVEVVVAVVVVVVVVVSQLWPNRNTLYRKKQN